MRVGLIIALTALVTALWAMAADNAAAPSTAPAELPAGTPKEALRSLNLAQRDGDAAAVRSFFLTVDEEGEKLVSAMADYTAALVALHKAAEKAYGPEGANLVTGDINAQSIEALAAIEKADVVYKGDKSDKADVTYAGAKDAPVQLVKVAGRWKLPLAQLLQGVDKALQHQRLKELLHQAGLASDMARELSNGKYKEGPARAAAVWRSRLLDPMTGGPTTKP